MCGITVVMTILVRQKCRSQMSVTAPYRKSPSSEKRTKRQRDEETKTRIEERKKGKIYEIRRREKMGNEKKTRGRQEGNKTKRER